MESYFPEKSRHVFSSNGKSVLKDIGLDIIKGVVFDVLCGKNLRDSTELLTRKRILSLNAATLVMMLKGTSIEENYVQKLPELAFHKLSSGKLDKGERWLMQWVLGLTDKAFQNVLRDNVSALENYKKSYLDITRKAIEEAHLEHGSISGTLQLAPKICAEINWDFLVQLMSTIGAQTLAIRGSDKSTFGKLFEKLILGALLSILGFEMVDPDKISKPNKVFWLSSRAHKRESDATLIYDLGKGVRFDIGFIGRGNPEISLDKVSRFEREIQIGKKTVYLATIIIVDRIGKNSRIETLAHEIGGYIIQMSGAFWPYKVADMLRQIVGYRNPILNVREKDKGSYIKEQLARVPFERLLNTRAFSGNASNSKD